MTAKKSQILLFSKTAALRTTTRHTLRHIRMLRRSDRRLGLDRHTGPLEPLALGRQRGHKTMRAQLRDSMETGLLLVLIEDMHTDGSGIPSSTTIQRARERSHSRGVSVVDCGRRLRRRRMPAVPEDAQHGQRGGDDDDVVLADQADFEGREVVGEILALGEEFYFEDCGD